MKIVWWILAAALLLCGCAQAPTFETLGDDIEAPVMQQQKQVSLTIPDASEKIQGSTGTIYICKDYTVTVEVLSSGNIGATMQSIAGFGPEDLTVLETSASDVTRYAFTWAAAGEGGDVVGNAAVLDDGVWHYCVTVLYNASDASRVQNVWNRILSSVKLV